MVQSQYFKRMPFMITFYRNWHRFQLIHWGRVTHIYVSKLTIIDSDSDNGWSADRRQAVIWINAEYCYFAP